MTCEVKNKTANRDTNASVNILNRGIANLGTEIPSRARNQTINQSKEMQQKLRKMANLDLNIKHANFDI